MPRLPRKPFPVEVKVRVAMQQLGEIWPDDVIRAHRRGLGKLLDQLVTQLCILLGEDKLNLDHNPALALRKKIKNRAGVIVRYDPPEHSIEHLIYRGAHAHHIKTQVRGDGAQHPDRVLIKRERRRQRKEAGVAIKRKVVKGPKASWHKGKAKSQWPQNRKIQSRGFRGKPPR